MTHRVWFHQEFWRFMPVADGITVERGRQPKDASAAGGNWKVEQEEPLHVSFSPGWCQRVHMRECNEMEFPDGTTEVQSNNVEVIW